MAPRYSNGSGFPAFRGSPRRDSASLLDDLAAFLAHCARSLRRFWKERGRHMFVASLARAVRQVRRNLTAARLLSLPHLLVAVWVVILLWGERWAFHSSVESCDWGNWENWVWLPTLPLGDTPAPKSSVATGLGVQLQMLTLSPFSASRSQSAPPRLRCRPPTNRPPFVSGTALAAELLHRDGHR